MNQIAYLVGMIDTNESPPRYLGCAVFSESTPTMRLSLFPFTIAQSRGEDFEDACAKLDRYLDEPFMTWARASMVRRWE